jgi:hypothetical protein
MLNWLKTTRKVAFSLPADSPPWNPVLLVVGVNWNPILLLMESMQIEKSELVYGGEREVG